MRIGYFGSDRFSLICLQEFLKCAGEAVKHLHLFVPPDSKGKLLQWAQNESKFPYSVMPPKSLKTFDFEWRTLDIGLVASFGYFIPGRIINSFPLGMLNAHPSLLPHFRGASPLQYSIMKGLDKSGVSIIDLCAKEFDAGNVWLQQSILINPYLPFNKLEEMLAILSGKMLNTVMKDYSRYSLEKRPQSGPITFAPKITRSHALIDFNQQNALDIFGIYQAIGHQEKLHFIAKGRDIIFTDVVDPRLFREEVPMGVESPGTVQLNRPLKTLFISAAGNSWIGVKNFRLSGKSNTFGAAEFYSMMKMNVNNRFFTH